MARQPGEWMQPVDDRILEHISDEGNLTPSIVADRVGISADYARKRCKQLSEYGLLNRIGRGLYGISEDGKAYLDEELDASQLEPADDS